MNDPQDKAELGVITYLLKALLEESKAQTELLQRLTKEPIDDTTEEK